MVQNVRYTLVGVGNIGRNLLDILAHRQACVLRDYGLRFSLVGVVDVNIVTSTGYTGCGRAPRSPNGSPTT